MLGPDRCSSFSLLAVLGLRSYGSQALSTSSIIAAHGLSCSGACGIFLDQGSNPCLLCWQADSFPLSHQESPKFLLLFIGVFLFYVKTSQMNHVLKALTTLLTIFYYYPYVCYVSIIYSKYINIHGNIFKCKRGL